jgi:hypothetical protein
MTVGLVLIGIDGAWAASPAELVAACNSVGGFGFIFGERPSPGANIFKGSLRGVPVSPAFTPLREAQLFYGNGSDSLNGVDATAVYASPAEAEQAVQDLVAVAKTDKRFPFEEVLPSPIYPVGDDPPIYIFSAGRGADGGSKGLSLGISRYDSELSLLCDLGSSDGPGGG